MKKNTIEEWRPVVGWEKLYEVSSLGRVNRLETTVRTCGTNMVFTTRVIKKRQLSPYIDFAGYERVTLCDSGRKKNVLVHRLVAIAFIPNPDNKPSVNHIDFNKLNNTTYNFEWCTHKENMRHAFKNGLFKAPTPRRGEQCHLSKLKDSDIIDIRKRISNGERILSIAGYFGVTRGNIMAIKSNKTWKHVR